MAKIDLEEELEKLKTKYPNMFIAGLKSYIDRNRLAINSKKELDKIIKDFEEIKI